VHEPQESTPPQPSEIEPHVAPWAEQVVGVQPQTFAAPAPPHVCGAVHEPQESVPPQPSEIVPQLDPCAEQVVQNVPGVTVTTNVACDWLLCASVAVHRTVVWPTGSTLPEAGVQAGVIEPST
jgi:hypothetical protein